MVSYFPHRSYPLPLNEDARLEAVRRLEFLVGPRFEPRDRVALDQLCELARTVLGVERAFISLVFEHEQRFIARANLTSDGGPRGLAFCAHAIAQTLPLIVQDAREDERFADHPMVTGPFGLRFYAGTPLEYDGQAVGTFCVVDSHPRDLSAEQLSCLFKIASAAREQILLLTEVDDLRQQAWLLRQAERLARMGGWEVDVEQRQVRWSRELYRLHEVDPSQPVTYEGLPRFYPNGQAERLGEAIARAVTTGQGFELELPYITASNAPRFARLTAEIEPRPGRPPRIVGTFRDITEQKEVESRWRKASFFDSVTGLPNRARLTAKLEELWATGSYGTLILVALDRFRTYSEQRGREHGDAVLSAFASCLQAHLPTSTFVARLTGSDFAILVPDVHEGDAIVREVLAIRRVVDSFFAAGGHGLRPGCSLGVAIVPSDADGAVEILRAAEIALQTARAGAGGATEYFAPALRQEIERKVALLEDVRRGLAANELLMHYQPICDVTGRALGFEALMRWSHPKKGLLGPAHFMAAFDDAELSVALGSLALAQALGHLREWLAAGVEPGYVAVNLSGAQLLRETLAEEIRESLRAFQVPPARLMLEVTETAYLDGNRERVASTLRALRGLGVSFALDDFGTGYASLTHLKDLAVDRLKVDKSFVQDSGKSVRDQAIVGAIVSLGLALGLQVVAEGVETAAQLAFVQGLGCELIQGYYFAKPMPPHEAAAFCERGGRAAVPGPPKLPRFPS